MTPLFNLDFAARQKIAERQALLSLNPDEAQAIADQTLHSSLWQVQSAGNVWTEQILTDSIKVSQSSLPPEALKDLLASIQQAKIELVLVGGQAINLWATQYAQPTPEWEQYRPFASVDLDFYGGRLEAMQCAEVLGGDVTLAQNFEPTPNAGVVTILWQDRPFRIDILASVYGLLDSDVATTALTFMGTGPLHGIQLKVLHPVLCLEGKLKCLANLPQVGRQDEKHLRLSILILQAFIMAQLNTQHPRMLLNLSEKVVNNLWTEAGLSVWYRHGIQIEHAIPIEAIAIDEPQWQRFLSIRWPQIQTQLSTKRSQYQRLMERF